MRKLQQEIKCLDQYTYPYFQLLCLLLLIRLTAYQPQSAEQYPESTSKAAPAQVKAPGDAPEGMVWIPGGTFTMSTAEQQAYGHEKPAYQVKVNGFWMDATEVTNEQYKAFKH